MSRWPLPARLVLAGAAGLAVGLVLTRLPVWAAVVVLVGVIVWAVVQLVGVHRDLNRLKAELVELERHMHDEAGG